MRGRYEMRAASGTRFQAEITTFELRQPDAVH
jgi:uncharacterized protein affecting Mg2+/Co2+ transport